MFRITCAGLLAWCFLFRVSVACDAATSATPAPPFGFSGPEIFPIDNQISHLHAADFDGDGLQDLLVVNNNRSRINILINQTGRTNLATAKQEWGRHEINELPPDARFRIESIPSEMRISAIVTADLNGDGKVDIAYYGEPKELIVLYNQGSNHWSSPQRWPIDDGQLNPNALTTGDINGDSRTDLLLLGENQVYVLEQGADGLLKEPRKIPFSGAAKSIQVVDVNGDHWQDLLLVNWEDKNPIRLRLQQPDGGLGPELYFPFSPVRSYVADNLVTSNELDLVTIAQSSGRAQLSRFKQEKAENFAPGLAEGQLQVIPLPRTSRAHRGACWGDLNGDGLLDLAAADPENGQITLYLGAPGGTFIAPQVFPTLAGVSDVCAGQWDKDGKVELFLLSAEERQVGMTRLDSKGSLPFPELLSIKGKPLAIALGRLRPKSVPTLAILSEEDGRRVLSLRTHAGAIKQLRLNSDFRAAPSAMSFQDVDQDGLMDLVILAPYQKFKILRQRDTGDFEELDVAPPGGLSDQPWLSSADTNGDGHPELLVAQRNFLRAVVLERDTASAERSGKGGPWSFKVRQQINGASSTSRIVSAAAVPAGSDKPLLFLLDAERKAVSACELGPDGTWSIKKNLSLPIPDFDSVQCVSRAGGKPDALALLGLNIAGILPLQGTNWTISELDSYETPIKDGHLMDVSAGDLNNDGRKDLVFLETSRNYADLVSVDPNGKFKPANRWQVFEERTFRGRRSDLPEPREALVADLTGDGKQDLALIVHDRILLYPQE